MSAEGNTIAKTLLLAHIAILNVLCLLYWDTDKIFFIRVEKSDIHCQYLVSNILCILSYVSLLASLILDPNSFSIKLSGFNPLLLDNIFLLCSIMVRLARYIFASSKSNILGFDTSRSSSILFLNCLCLPIPQKFLNNFNFSLLSIRSLFTINCCSHKTRALFICLGSNFLFIICFHDDLALLFRDMQNSSYSIALSPISIIFPKDLNASV
ncbi:unknown [La Crosse virus]|uniref:Uncharacterized protein n=1 Tax=Bunyavirus La Crosse TaxID=11577 RepID=Q82999_BUNLC|nr:unknown [La Crosse virus]